MRRISLSCLRFCGGHILLCMLHCKIRALRELLASSQAAAYELLNIRQHPRRYIKNIRFFKRN